MKFTRKLPLAILASVLLVFTLLASCDSSSSDKDKGPTVIDVFSFNDFHGTVDKSASGSNPGADRFTAIVQKLMSENPNSTLLCAGDSYQGSPLSNIFEGEPVSDMIKYLGVKYSAVGNHEFDWGSSLISKFATDGGITFLAANIVLKGTNTSPVFCEPYAIITIGGKKIGIIGLTTTSVPTLVKAEYVEDYDFKEPGPWLDDLINDLKTDKGCNLVIALTHMGATQNNDTKVVIGEAANLATTCPGFDAIIAGHSHSLVAGVVNGIPIVQGNYNGRGLGRLTITIDGDAVSIEPKCYVQNDMNLDGILPNDPLVVNEDVKAIIAGYNNEIGPYFAEVVGKYGTAITDRASQAVWATKVVWDYIERETDENYILVQNDGGWRSTNNAYAATEDVTLGYLYTLMPFDNEIVLLEMQGKDILYMLNEANLTGYASVAGAYCDGGTFNEDAAAGRLGWNGGTWKLTDGTEIANNTTVYKVACNDFMVTGGDNYPFPGSSQGNTAGVVKIKDHTFMGVPLRDAMIEELQYRAANAMLPSEATFFLAWLGSFARAY